MIDGKTSLYGLLGYPLSHTYSPLIHNTISEYLGHNNIYVPFSIDNTMDKVLSSAATMNIKGMNVTIPYKELVIPHLKGIDDLANKIGAVNTLVLEGDGYIGYNTDALGLLKSLKSSNISVENKEILVLGAGGAARATIIMLAHNKAKKIHIYNRTKEKAINIANHVNKHYNVDINILDSEMLNSIKDIDICIQTTPVGMYPKVDKSPIENTEIFSNINTCVDLIYNPQYTRFLKIAKENGCSVLNGFDMLYYQAVLAYELFNHITIDDSDINTIKKNIYKAIMNK